MKIKAAKKYLFFFFRYVISGFSSVVVQFGFLGFLVEILKMYPTIASAIAFVVGCVVNYLLLYYWTFESEGMHRTVFRRYMIVTLMGFFVNLALFWALVHLMGWWYPVAQTASTIFVALVAFVMNLRFTFLSAPKIEKKNSNEFK